MSRQHADSASSQASDASTLDPASRVYCRVLSAELRETPGAKSFVEYKLQFTRGPVQFDVKRRYSKLREVHMALCKAYHLPPFPPKRIFPDVEKRSESLALYYEKLGMDKEVLKKTLYLLESDAIPEDLDLDGPFVPPALSRIRVLTERTRRRYSELQSEVDALEALEQKARAASLNAD